MLPKGLWRCVLLEIEECRRRCVLAKSKLDPIKSMRIPRLEMMAAVIAVHLDATLRKELRLRMNMSVERLIIVKGFRLYLDVRFAVLHVVWQS